MLEYIAVPVNINVDRDKFLNGVNNKIGKGDWFWGFRVGKRLYSWNWGIQLYEDAYWEFLKQNPTKIRSLVDYSNIYVYDRHDLDSGLDFKKN